MNLLRRRALLGSLLLAAASILTDSSMSQAAPGLPAATLAAAPMPPMPPLPSLTRSFRKLLEMKPEERSQLLSNRPANIRQQLEAKIQEYAAMSPGDREARLQATELHEYLEYFIRNSTGDRSTQLALVPQEYRLLVSNRLTQFDLLPPPLREEVLSRESTSNYFVGPGLPRPGASRQPPPPMPPDPLKSFGTLSRGERFQIYGGFEKYFDLSDDEKKQVIELLPMADRPRVIKTLDELDKLPRDERAQGLQAIGSFVGMSEDQRRIFLQNAERWKTMSPAERETWLKLVKHLPPMPPPPFPALDTRPMPPTPRLPLSASTNPGN